MEDEVPIQSSETPEKEASAYLASGFLVGGGRFSLLRELARGGMGVVWLAHDERLVAPVALKFLPEAVRNNPTALSDLRQETQKSRMLSHPNIIRIYDLYEAPDEAAFISMEYVDGPSLWVLRSRQPQRCFSWDYLKPIVKQLCQALDYAHGERVIHRDLKPANMLLDDRQRLRLADFGIAARDFESSAQTDGRHRTSGTPAYMSPQQIDGGAARVTDDIYALGATLYELLTTQPPFYQNDISYQVRNVVATPLSERLADLEVNNEVPEAVAAMIMACLAKNPEKRPQTARAVAEWSGLTESTPLPVTSFSPAVPPLPAADIVVPIKEAKKTPVPLMPAEESEPTPTTEENPVSRRFAMIAGSAGLGLVAWLAWTHFMPQMPSFPNAVSIPETNAADSTSLRASNAIPSSDETSASIELGETNRENGLRQVTTGIDMAATKPAHMGGKDCRLLESRQRARCFFQILPAFKHAGAMNARIKVEYYSLTRGGMQLRFDGSSGQTPHYANGGGKTIEGEGAWKNAYFELNDAVFHNGEKGGADFCLATSCRELYVHSVSVFFEP